MVTKTSKKCATMAEEIMKKGHVIQMGAVYSNICTHTTSNTHANTNTNTHTQRLAHPHTHTNIKEW